MDPAEQPLLQALEATPDDWTLRLMIAEKQINRGAPDEASKLICSAPNPPNSDFDLQKAADLGGIEFIPLAEQYTVRNPTNSYSHTILAHLLESAGDLERAENHTQVAATLSGAEQAVAEAPVAESPPQPPEISVPAISKPASVESTSLPQPDAVLPTAVQHAPEKIQAIGSIPATKPLAKPKSRKGGKTTAIIVTIAVHVAIALIATLMVILPPSKDEPEIVAITAPAQTSVKQEMKKKTVQKMVKRSPSSSSSAAAPMAVMMRANTKASFSAPEVTKTSTGPLGMGEGDLGSGGFGIGTGLGDGSGNGGGAETMFGSTGTNGLVGTFYDLKQDRKRKRTGFEYTSRSKYFGLLNKFGDSNFRSSEVADFYTASQKMSFTNLLIPDMDADVGPKAFNVEKEVKPAGWFVHYSGTVSCPESGEWRFVGRFDDALSVYVNGKIVFDGSRHFIKERDEISTPVGTVNFTSGQTAVAGKWVKLSGRVKIDIIVGEQPGARIGGALLIEKKGGSYERKNGAPVLPLFSTVPLSKEVKERISKVPYAVSDRNTPVFRVVGR